MPLPVTLVGHPAPRALTTKLVVLVGSAWPEPKKYSSGVLCPSVWAAMTCAALLRWLVSPALSRGLASGSQPQHKQPEPKQLQLRVSWKIVV